MCTRDPRLILCWHKYNRSRVASTLCFYSSRNVKPFAYRDVAQTTLPSTSFGFINGNSSMKTLIHYRTILISNWARIIELSTNSITRGSWKNENLFRKRFLVWRRWFVLIKNRIQILVNIFQAYSREKLKNTERQLL